MTSQDLVKGIDITGLSTVTGSEMNQLVDVARPASDKGLVIVTTDTALDTPDVPNPDVELESVTPTHWYRYIWIRKGFNSTVRPKLYVWDNNATSHATYLKWYEIIADLTTVQSDIASLETRMTDAETDITAIDTQADAAYNIASNADTIASVANDTANAAQAGVDNNATAIAALDTRLDTAETEIAKISPFPTAADKILVSAAVDDWDETTLTTFMRTLLDDVDAATARATLGILSNLRHDYALYQYVASDGTNGGTATAGGWQTIPLTEETADTGNNGALAANEITLAAGTYRFKYNFTGHFVNRFLGRLYNVTDAVEISRSRSPVFSSDTVALPQVASHFGRFTLAAQKVIRLEGYFYTTRNTDGLGYPSSPSTDEEVYAVLELWKE